VLTPLCLADIGTLPNQMFEVAKSGKLPAKTGKKLEDGNKHLENSLVMTRKIT
jgi:hypothetical protein